VIITLGQMVFLCLFILSLVYFAYRANRGRWVPAWAAPLLVHNVTVGAEGRIS
jgi:hypothetical protein